MKTRRTLQHRLNTLLLRAFAVGVPALFVVMAVVDAQLRTEAIETRTLLTRAVAHHVDELTASALQRLGRLAGRLPALDESAVPVMRAFRFQNIMHAAVSVLDEEGRIVVADPESVEPWPRELLPDREMITPLVRKPGATHPTVAMIQPFKHQGRPYFLVAELDPIGSPISAFLETLGSEQQLHVLVVDDKGEVLAARDAKHLFAFVPGSDVLSAHIKDRREKVYETAECGVCDRAQERGSFLNVLVPLRLAPWGILLQQETDHAFAAVYIARRVLWAGGIILLVLGIGLSRALTRSLVAPIQSLSEQAERMRQGELGVPIAVEGDHEIVSLASTLDEGRVRLAASLERLRMFNEALEHEVASRTRALQAQNAALELRNEVFRLSTHEDPPERYVPLVLRAMAGHFTFPAIALATEPREEHPAIRATWPPTATLAWFETGDPPPPGWQTRELRHHDTLYARLFHPTLAGHDDALMDVVAGRLAISLHDAALLERTLVQDQERRVLVRRLLTAGEEERKRIARELHDEIAQLLTVIQLSLDDAGVDHPGLRRARDLLSRTQKEVHRIIYDLRPSLLDDLGLAAAVRSHAASHLIEKGIETSVAIDDDLDLSPEVEIAAFRIYQEIVTNILRHSRAQTVSVEMYTDDGAFVLAVEDDGVGFDVGARTNRSGLVGMRERAALVGGTIAVTSEPGLGTQVTVRIPLQP